MSTATSRGSRPRWECRSKRTSSRSSRARRRLYVRPGFLIPEVTLVTQVDDEQAAVATVDKIVKALAEYLPAAQHVNEVEIDGIDAKEVAVSPPVSVYYAAFDGHLVVTTSRDGIAQLRQDGDRLADDSSFKDALEQAGMPDETAGFAYVNLHDAIRTS